MSGLTRKHPTKENDSFIHIWYENIHYRFPKAVAERYRVDQDGDEELIDSDEVFSELNAKYTKSGALLKGIRARENVTQVEMARRLGVTQSDISQMENGRRVIGKIIAKRIEALFGVSYRIFLG